jgi:hypothetical protein
MDDFSKSFAFRGLVFGGESNQVPVSDGPAAANLLDLVCDLPNLTTTVFEKGKKYEFCCLVGEEESSQEVKLSKIFTKKEDEAAETRSADFGATPRHSAKHSVTVLERDAARQSHLEAGTPVLSSPSSLPEKGWSLWHLEKRSRVRGRRLNLSVKVRGRTKQAWNG